jgi:uncharacterized cupin superfamily protein
VESVVGPGGGREIQFGPSRLLVKLDAASGAQGLLVVETHFPPGAGGTPLHVHARTEEACWVLEGEIEYRIGETVVRATAGTCVFLPAGVPHAFRNAGQSPARHLAIATNPHLAAMIAALDATPREEIPALMERYDTALVAED